MDHRGWFFSYCYYVFIGVSFLYLKGGEKKKHTTGFPDFCVIMASLYNITAHSLPFILGFLPNQVRVHK